MEGVAIWPNDLRDYVHSESFKPYAKGMPAQDGCWGRVLKRHGWTAKTRRIELYDLARGGKETGAVLSAPAHVWVKDSTLKGVIKTEFRWNMEAWRFEDTKANTGNPDNVRSDYARAVRQVAERKARRDAAAARRKAAE